MANQNVKEIGYGISFAFLFFLLVFSAFPVLVPVRSHAASAPLFSVTLLAPVTNPQRRAYASIITQSLQSEGIGASLAYVTFSTLSDRLFPNYTISGGTVPLGATYSNGGFDLGFIGWTGFGIPPDPEFWFLGNTTANFPPGGNDYYLYNSSTTNALITKYIHTIDPAARVTLLKNIEAQLYNDVPQATILYQNAITAVPSTLTWYGQPATKLNPVAFPDLEHFGGVTALHLEQTGDVSNFDPLPISTSNSVYAANSYLATVGFTEPLDPRTTTYYLGLASSITHTPDNLTWTITVKPSTFQDSVPVNAEDYMYYYWATLNPAAGSVNFGTFVTNLGGIVTFTWKNGTQTTIDNSAATGNSLRGSIKWLSDNSWSITLPSPYAFTDPTFTDIFPLPMHYLQQIPVGSWSTDVYSTGIGSKLITWNTQRFSGNGSCTIHGPFSNGPYVFGGYNPTSKTVTLYKNANYWNATGLQSMNEFSITTYTATSVTEKTAAEADYKSGVANYLDQNFFSASDLPTLQGIGATIAQAPSPGYQELGFNMLHPVFGTGKATPDGTAHPANAAKDAMYVRQAINHLIPRQLIIQSLYSGGATAGVTPIGPFYGAYQNSSLTAYTYDPSVAAALLAKAGYTVPAFAPNQLSLGTNQILAGGSVSLSGKFVNPVNTTQVYDHALVTIEQSTDNKTWTKLGYTTTSSTGSYTYYVTPTTTGTLYFLANMTGYFGNQSTVYLSASTVPGAKVPPGVPFLWGYAQGQNVNNDTFYLLGKTQLSTVETVTVQPANALSTITSYAYAAVAAAVVIAVVLGVLLFIRRKRP